MVHPPARKALSWVFAALAFVGAAYFYFEAAIALYGDGFLEGLTMDLSNPATKFVLSGILATVCAILSVLNGVFHWRVQRRLAKT